MKHTTTTEQTGQSVELDVEALELEHILYGSDAYYQTLELRDQILRAPLGLSIWDEDLKQESGQHHFAFLDTNDRPLACLVAVPLGEQRVKLRQMAVAETCRGMGLGRALMQQVEQLIRDAGMLEASLHARVSAQGFYERMGYKALGDVFTEVTVPHVLMVKQLN